MAQRRVTARPPLVSVGVPVYNGAHYLPAALESIVRQTWRDLEVIVVDNGSTDGSGDIAQRFADADSRVRVVRSAVNKGAAWSHNEAFRLSTGTFFRWASHDDAAAPQLLERCLERLLADESLVLARAQAAEIDDEGRHLFVHPNEIDVSQADPMSRFSEVLCRRHACMDVYGLIRSDVLRRTNLIGPYPASDRVLLAALALHGPWARIQEPLFLHRQHAERSVRRFPDRRRRAIWFEPLIAGKRGVFPAWRKLKGYVDAVRGAPLTPAQRWRCYGLLGAWSLRDARALGGDVWHAFRPMPDIGVV